MNATLKNLLAYIDRMPPHYRDREIAKKLIEAVAEIERLVAEDESAISSDWLLSIGFKPSKKGYRIGNLWMINHGDDELPKWRYTWGGAIIGNVLNPTRGEVRRLCLAMKVPIK